MHTHRSISACTCTHTYTHACVHALTHSVDKMPTMVSGAMLPEAQQLASECPMRKTQKYQDQAFVLHTTLRASGKVALVLSCVLMLSYSKTHSNVASASALAPPINLGGEGALGGEAEIYHFPLQTFCLQCLRNLLWEGRSLLKGNSKETQKENWDWERH